MTSQDFFYYSWGFGFLIGVGFLSYALYNLAITLKELKSVLEKVDDVATGVDEIKNSIKFGLLNVVSMFLKKGVKEK